MAVCSFTAACDCVNATGDLVSLRVDNWVVEHAAFNVFFMRQQIRRTHHNLEPPPPILAAHSVLKRPEINPIIFFYPSGILKNLRKIPSNSPTGATRRPLPPGMLPLLPKKSRRRFIKTNCPSFSDPGSPPGLCACSTAVLPRIQMDRYPGSRTDVTLTLTTSLATSELSVLTATKMCPTTSQKAAFFHPGKKILSVS